MVPNDATFVEGDVGNAGMVGALIAESEVVAVIHLAGSIVVPESVTNPLKYYRNNSIASANLIQACVGRGVQRFVFSSSAAVYGIPASVPVPEDAPTVPISPYGRSKLITEWMLRDTSTAHDFRYAALRYFNVAGADPHGRAGQSTPNATHLVKIACEAATGSRPGITVFGTDYDTPDGTCIRDYIHVSDLAAAHVAALRALENGGESRVLNCGYGHGFSVRQILETVQSEAGVSLDEQDGPRRPGDPPVLVSNPSLLRKSLQWVPRYDDLGLIVRTALSWERGLVEGRELPRSAA